MKARCAKLICVGMIAMLLVSCIQKPVGQKQDTSQIPTNTEEQLVAEDFLALKLEKIFTLPFDINIKRPLLLQANLYFYRDFDFDTHQEHHLALNIDSKKIQWDKTYPDLEFPITQHPQLNQDLVLFQSTNGDKYSFESKILALKIEDGSKQWTCHIVGIINSMTLIKKTLFVSTNSYLNALDFQTGKILWSKSIYDFFPGYSKEKDYYRFNAINSNQNTIFVTYALNKKNNSQNSSDYLGCLAIQPENGSVLWKYEKELKDWLIATTYSETLDVIGSYLIVYDYTLLDASKGNMVWQFVTEKPENDYDGAFHSEPTSFYVGYSSVEQLCFYRICHEVDFEIYSTTLFGVDVNTRATKWKQECRVKTGSENSQSSVYIDQNHQTDNIFVFYSKMDETEKDEYKIPMDRMDVYSNKDGKLLQSYKIPASCWFSDLKSEIRFHEGWWYFIGETSTDGGDQDTLFRFQLNQ